MKANMKETKGAEGNWALIWKPRCAARHGQAADVTRQAGAADTRVSVCVRGTPAACGQAPGPHIQ